jgi:Xaa-Pro aminopeptidase
MPTRLERLSPLVDEAQVDVLLVTGHENRRYLSGFTGSAGAMLVTTTGVWLIVDFRYWEQAARQAPNCEIVRLEPMTRLESLLPGLIAAHGWQRVGVEADHLTVDAFDSLTQAFQDGPAVTLVKTTGLIEQLRQSKDARELQAIQAAIDLTDQAMEHAAGLLRPGLSEAALAWELESYMRTHGAEGLAFPVIVAFGPNSALPHHHPGERLLQPADPIVIDMGARVDGYCADLTRSFCLAPESSRYSEVYAVVLEALQTAEQQLHAGLTGQQADAIARDVINNRGYGSFFGHGLGHSLGLAIHEPPSLSRLNEQPLPVGAIETIEPGIYIPDWGGIRIEDVVVLEEQRARILTGSPK